MLPVIEEFVQECDLVIIDNISTLFRSGDENEAESWQPVQDWILDLRRRGKSVLFVHHAAKAGQQRGTSKREDILDTVITLKQPQGYCADQGACFDVTFEKTRHFSGDDAAPFNVRLKVQDNGVWLWTVDNIAPDADLIKVAEAIGEGLTIEKTAQRTGLTKSQVETRKKKAKEQNLL
jgi:putative DNA primase/helicase